MWCKKSAREQAKERAQAEAANLKNEAASAVNKAVGSAREKYEDVSEAAGSHLHDWRESVTEAATHAWDVLAHKAADLAADLSQRASESAHQAQEVARVKAGLASEVAHKKWDEVSHDRLEPAQQAARQKFAEVSTRAADAAQSAQSAARERAQRAANRAQTAAQIAASQAPDVIQNARQNAMRRGGELGVKLGSAIIDKSAPYAPHAVKKAKEPDWSSKLMWIGAGVFAGAVIALLLSPNSGRRNRALLKDKLNKASHEASDLKEAAVKKAEHLSNKASGLAHDLKERAHSDTKAGDTKSDAKASDAKTTDETKA